jgi:hypothetical protein
MMQPMDTLPLPSESAAAHVDSLPRVLRPVTLNELTAIPAERTLRQALPDLRPYWMQFTGGRFRVDIAGQLVGEDALDRISIGNVGLLRLIFAPVEPHWTLRIDFR